MKSSLIMFVYAAFLLACAGTAYQLAPDKTKASTALIAGGIAAGLMILCGLLARLIHSNRRWGMIGIHVGLVLPILYAIEFARRSIGNFTKDDGKTYLAVIFLIMALGSVAAFAFILKTRPAPEARK